MHEPPAHVAGVGVPWYGGAETWMWMNSSQPVRDEDMAAGEMDEDSLGRRTMRGLGWQR